MDIYNHGLAIIYITISLESFFYSIFRIEFSYKNIYN